MSNPQSIYQRVRRLKWVSPGSFVLCSLTFAGVYAVLHLFGFREYTSIFCGTLPADHTRQIVVGFCGLIYTMFHMLTVLVAPILLIAAGLFYFASRCDWNRAASPPGSGSPVGLTQTHPLR